MKRFKKIDYWISILLIAGFIITELIKQDSTFIAGYFVVGAWQIISMMVHAVNGWFVNKKGTRYCYHWVVAVVCGLGLIALTGFEMFWLLLYLLLFIAPFMAICYTALCIKEVHIKMRRPMDLLK